MLSKSCHLPLAGSPDPGSVLPAWLRSTLPTAACTPGAAAAGPAGTSVCQALCSHFILSLARMLRHTLRFGEVKRFLGSWVHGHMFWFLCECPTPPPMFPTQPCPEGSRRRGGGQRCPLSPGEPRRSLLPSCCTGPSSLAFLRQAIGYSWGSAGMEGRIASYTSGGP